MTRFIVKRHRPWQWAISVVILSMIIASLTWLMLDKSHWSMILGRFQDNHSQKVLWETNQRLEKENVSLHKRLLMLEQTTSLDKQTAILLQDDIRSMQEEIYDLKGELEFYQGIMEDAGGAKGLDVHGVHVKSLSQRHNYRLKVVLTNVARTGSVVEGKMAISVEGTQDGNTILLSLSELSLERSLDMAFKFRNFKRFESNMVLPEGFSPQRVLVQLTQKGKKQSTIKKVFDWPVVAS